jgi:hypothetical protein
MSVGVSSQVSWSERTARARRLCGTMKRKTLAMVVFLLSINIMKLQWGI